MRISDGNRNFLWGCVATEQRHSDEPASYTTWSRMFRWDYWIVWFYCYNFTNIHTHSVPVSQQWACRLHQRDRACWSPMSRHSSSVLSRVTLQYTATLSLSAHFLCFALFRVSLFLSCLSPRYNPAADRNQRYYHCFFFLFAGRLQTFKGVCRHLL